MNIVFNSRAKKSRQSDQVRSKPHRKVDDDAIIHRVGDVLEHQRFITSRIFVSLQT